MKLIKTREQVSEIKVSWIHLEDQVILMSICSDLRQGALTITVLVFASSRPKYHKNLYASIDKLLTSMDQS